METRKEDSTARTVRRMMEEDFKQEMKPKCGKGGVPRVLCVRVANTGLISAREKKSEKE
jgi:hypothetical protein